MAANWVATTEHPTTKHRLYVGPVAISVTEEEPERRWQYFCLTISKYSPATAAECLATWPAEAIARARAELDELEAQLAE
jgi:hypothetical protein